MPAVEQRVARMRLANQEILVEIIDESAEGFAILLEGTLDCHIGQTALLQVEAGRVEVRVMNASVAELATTNEAGETYDVVCTRLGLRRLRDLPNKVRVHGFWGLVQSIRKPMVPLYSTWSGAVLTVLTVICGGTLLVTGLEYPPRIITLARRELRSAPAPTNPPAPAQRSYDWTAWFAPSWSWGTGAAPSPSDVPADLVRLTRPDVVLHPDTIARLGLSASQLEQLRAKVSMHSAAAGHPKWDHEAAQSVVAILTPEQLAKLQQLAHAAR